MEHESARAVMERRYGELGTGQTVLMIAGREYRLREILARWMLDVEGILSVDGGDLGGDRHWIRFHDSDDLRFVVFEFDAAFDILSEMRADSLAWEGDDSFLSRIRAGRPTGSDPVRNNSMDMRRKEDFLDRRRKCFGGAELPITCWYTDDEGTADPSEPAKGHRCLIADLAKIRKGESLRVYPLLEMDASRPRAVLGMYDVSARPFVPGSTLSFAVPVNKFAAMIDDMEESFLVTESWKAVRRRMG